MEGALPPVALGRTGYVTQPEDETEVQVWARARGLTTIPDFVFAFTSAEKAKKEGGEAAFFGFF